MVLDFQHIGDAIIILEFANNSKSPPTAFSSDLNDASPIPMMTKSSLDPILENLIFDFLSQTFFRTLDIFSRSEIFAELFFLLIVKAV